MFSNLFVSWVRFLVSAGVSLLQVLRQVHVILFKVISPFSFSVILFEIPILAPETFCFLCIQLFICLSAFSINLFVELFRYFRWLSFAFSTWFYLSIFWLSLISPISFLVLMHLCYRKKAELSRAFPERIRICRNDCSIATINAMCEMDI